MLETKNVILPDYQENSLNCTSEMPSLLDQPTTEQLKLFQTWTDNDFPYKNYILNGLCDDLYNYCSSCKTAKEFWDALQKYDTEEAEAKKFAISRYLKYQMIDDKSVEPQSHKLQKIAHEIISERMNLDEQFQVVVIIDKLPSSWKEFKKNMRYKTREFSLESPIIRLHIEEEARKQDMREKVLVVSNNNKKKAYTNSSAAVVLKRIGKNMKNTTKNIIINKKPLKVQNPQ